jgi:predicted GNAT family acetyltransferase
MSIQRRCEFEKNPRYFFHGSIAPPLQIDHRSVQFHADAQTPSAMKISYHNSLDDIDWPALKAALAADNFDNGRTPEQLQRSFRNSQGVCISRCDNEIVGAARVLSDGICNAYLLDVWTTSRFRRRGIAREMIERLTNALPGQHVYLQADGELAEFYHRLGFAAQPVGMSRVIGNWLVNQPGCLKP